MNEWVNEWSNEWVNEWVNVRQYCKELRAVKKALYKYIPFTPRRPTGPTLGYTGSTGMINTTTGTRRVTALTLSSTISMEKSLPSPRELLHVRMLLRLVTRARMVHLAEEKREAPSVNGLTHAQGFRAAWESLSCRRSRHMISFSSFPHLKYLRVAKAHRVHR